MSAQIEALTIENKELKLEKSQLMHDLMLTDRQLNSILSSAPDIVYRLDSNGRITFLSDSVANYGYDPRKMVGVHILDFIHPDDREKAQFKVNERRTGPRSTKSFEVRMLSKDQQIVPVEIKENKITSDSVFLFSSEGLYSEQNPDHRSFLGTLGIARDITERLKSEEDLKDSKYKYHRLFEESNDAIFIFDDTGSIHDINIKACDMLGYTRNQLCALSFVELHPEHQQETFFKGVRLSNDDGTSRFDSQLLKMNSDTIDVEISMRLIDDEERFYQGIVRDITERKYAEEQIRNSLEEKEVLLSEIHHRVKNNIQVVSSLLSLQAERIEDEQTKAAFHESINRIQSIGLIHTMLYQSESFTQIDFDEYAEKIAESLMRFYATDQGRVKIITDIDQLYLKLDAAIPCGLVINELLTNALKHAFPGDARGVIKISMKRLTKTTVRLIIWDNGIGVPDDFDLNGNETLGLKIVDLLIKRQLFGDVRLSSGDGSKFVITFDG